MKIHSIQIRNFIGARAVDLNLGKPVALVAGKNGAGKSSIRDAIAFAFTADLCRVSLKKEAGQLISDGGESCFVEVAAGSDTYGVAISAAGNISDSMKGKETPAALPYVLDAQRFARMTDNERRAFLFGLMGVKMDGPSIKERMLAKGCDAAKIEQIKPILRAGFDAAQKEAAAKARDAKASWKTTTGGETWGKDKAAKWMPAPAEGSVEDAEKMLQSIRTVISADDADIGILQQQIGAAKAEISRRQSAESRRIDLASQADQVERIKAKLERDEAEAEEWQKKVDATRVQAGIASAINTESPAQYLLRGLASVTDDFLTIAHNNPGLFDDGLINRASTHLAEYKKQHGWPHSSKEETATEGRAKAEANAKLPEYEKALELMRRSVANGKRDLEAAIAAKAEYERIIAEQGTALPDVSALEKTLSEITVRRDAYRADEKKHAEIAQLAASRQAVIMKAAMLHADVMAWTDIADALAPDGIPAELLNDALGPINEHLRLSAADAEWEPAQINADMSITYGLRDYALISESEKWRTDAMIAEAVSFLSGMRLLVLDRFDVLDMKGREDLLYWVDGLAQDGNIDTALIFGTLKSIPALAFETIEAHWIENGTAGQMKEAA